MKKMMKCAIVTVVMALAASAWAVSETEETIDGVTWRYKISDGAEITGCELKNGSPAAIAIPSRLGGHLITRIGKFAFHGCSGSRSVTIPSGVTSIEDWAFSGCRGLTNITIPATVMRIGDMAFQGCNALNSIAVDAANPNFKSVDGELLSKDGKLLIHAKNRAETNSFYPYIRCRGKSGTVQVQIRTVTEEDAGRMTSRVYWNDFRGSVDVKEGRCYPLGSIVRMNGEGKTSARCVFEFGDNASLVASEGAEFAITGNRGLKLTLVILKGRIDLKLPLDLKGGRFRVETPFCSCENLAGESRFKYCLLDKEDDRGRHDNIIVHCVAGSMALFCGHFKFPHLVPANQVRITQELLGSRHQNTVVTSIKGEAGECRALLDTENLFKRNIKTEEMLEKAKTFDFLLSPQCVIKESESFKIGCRTHLSIMTINVNGEKKSHVDLNFPEPKVEEFPEF